MEIDLIEFLILTIGIGCMMESKTQVEKSKVAIVESDTTLSVTLTSIGIILTSSGNECIWIIVGNTPCFSELK